MTSAKWSKWLRLSGLSWSKRLRLNGLSGLSAPKQQELLNQCFVFQIDLLQTKTNQTQIWKFACQQFLPKNRCESFFASIVLQKYFVNQVFYHIMAHLMDGDKLCGS